MSTIPRVPSALGDEPATFLTALAHQPELANAFFDLYGTLWSHGVVDHVTKETVRVRNARVTDCGFCKNVRFDQAREEGLSEDLVAQIVDGHEDSDLSPPQKAALRLADVYLAGGVPDAALIVDLGRHFRPDQLVELVLAVSLFKGLAKVLIGLGTEPESMPTTVLPTPDRPARA